MQAYDRASARRKAGGNTIIRGLCQRRAGRRGGSDRPGRSAALARRLTSLRFRFSLLCTTSALTQHWLSLQSGDHCSTEGAVVVQCCGLQELPQSVSLPPPTLPGGVRLGQCSSCVSSLGRGRQGRRTKQKNYLLALTGWLPQKSSLGGRRATCSHWHTG